MNDKRTMHRPRSPWEKIREADTSITPVPTDWWSRKVHDGTLLAAVTEETVGWHLSVSFRNHKGDYSRYPTWDELVHARDVMLPKDVAFVQHLPTADEYVNLEATTFHLFEHPPRETQ